MKFPKIEFDKNNNPVVTPVEPPSSKPTWREIWGDRFDRIVRSGNHEILERIQQLKRQGDISQAITLLEEYLAFRKKDNARPEGLAPLFKSLAHLCYIKNDLARAKNYYIQAAELFLSSNNEKDATLCIAHLGTCSEAFARSDFFAQHTQSLREGNELALPRDVLERVAQNGVTLFNSRNAHSENIQERTDDQASHKEKKSWWQFWK